MSTQGNSTAKEVSSHHVYLPHGVCNGELQELSAMDLLNIDLTIPFIWYYAETLDHKRLISSLKEVLVHYPVLTGRWSGVGPGVTLDNRGVPVEVASDPRSVTDITDRLKTVTAKENPQAGPVAISIYRTLFHSKAEDPLYDSDTSNFMMTAKFTLCNPGTIIALTILHAITDSEGFLSFTVNWSRVYRGLPILPIPDHDRTLKKLVTDSIELPPPHLPGAAIEYGKSEKTTLGPMDVVPITPDHTAVVVPMTQKRLAEIKAIAMESITDGRWVSTDDCLSALVWRAKVKVTSEHLGLALDSEEPSILIRAMNCRTRTTPPLTSRYFGSSVLPAYTILSVKQICSMSIAEIALLLRAAMQENTPEVVSAVVNYMRKTHEEGGKFCFHHDSKAPSFMITSWSHGQTWEDVIFESKPLNFDHAGHIPYIATICARPNKDGFSVWTSGTPTNCDKFITEMARVK